MDSQIADKVTEFFSKYPQRTFDKGQLLTGAEEAPAGVFYIVEGRVSQYDIASTGNEVVVNVFKPGAFFPMSWALNGTTNHYFFEASTDVVVHQAPPEEAVEFLRTNPDVMLDLMARVYRGIDGVLRRMAHLMGGDSKTRLLFELLNATYRFGEPNDEGHLFVPLKEGDLARHSGLARETVNRTIQRLKNEDLVEVGRTGIVIKDIKRLEDMLGTDV